MELGINFIDTADVYGNMPVFDRPGALPAAERDPAEEILGRALRGRRDDVVIATKSNGIVGLGVNDRGLSRRHIVRQVETSLRRLETDWIDLYYAHDPDPDTPLEETLSVYDDLIRQGKIRYVGLSNHPAWQVVQSLWIADDRRLVSAPVAAQVKYNLIDRAAERELAPACEMFGLSIVPYAPLHGGLLADLAVLDRDVAGDQRFGAAGFSDAEIALARKVDALAREWGLTPYQVSLAWLLSRPAVASVIVGAETVDELHERHRRRRRARAGTVGRAHFAGRRNTGVPPPRRRRAKPAVRDRLSITAFPTSPSPTDSPRAIRSARQNCRSAC